MPTFRNSLLSHLDPAVIDRLSLQPVEFELFHEIEYPGNPIDNIFFVETGMASMTASFSDGEQVEVAIFGYESVIGISALMGTRRSLNRVYTQVAGQGYACAVNVARTEFSRGLQFQQLALRFVQAQLVQSLQSTGCNAKHSAEQRLARWLLICADRVHSNVLVLSHELLSQMIGSTRPTVSIAASILKSEGLIEYTRGTVRIVDPSGLERRACECYHIIRQHLDNYAEFDTGFIA